MKYKNLLNIENSLKTSKSSTRPDRRLYKSWHAVYLLKIVIFYKLVPFTRNAGL